jgi:Na+-translocating ferredoxin:NAD+ oxidoreductase RNF subunit RnfB
MHNINGLYINRPHGSTHGNTSEVGCTRTAQIHEQPQNGAYSRPDAMTQVLKDAAERTGCRACVSWNK